MSVLNRLFGQSKSSGSERKSGASNARLGLESLEVREVPAVAGLPASPGEFPYQVSMHQATADPLPTEQLAINYTKITFEYKPQVPPASDYLLELDGVQGESRATEGHREQIEIASWSLGASAGSTAPVSDDGIVDSRDDPSENYAGIVVGTPKGGNWVSWQLSTTW